MFNIEQLQYYLAQDRVAKAVLGILLFFLLLSIFQLLKTSLMSTQQSITEEAVTQTHTEAFVVSPLFGQSPTSGVLQQTRLNLTLKGTFAASASKAGAAIINNKAGDKIYIVGDTVEGAIIEDIQPDYVVLEYQGNREMLRLPEGQRLTKP
jgi:type II secretory pathway component PulC